MKTYMPKATEVERKWYLIDADGLVLGRLASQVASILKGKNKPTFTPNMDMGDYVIVINTDKMVLTGKKTYWQNSLPSHRLCRKWKTRWLQNFDGKR